jgi:alanine racemase
LSWPPARPARARLTIDKGAVARNWRQLAGRAAPAEAAAVVKADAYGLGLAEIAPALWAAGARTFFVARLDEGLGLRDHLPNARIFVLDGLGLGGAEEMVAHDLVPVLNQPLELAAWRDHAMRLGRRLPAAIQVDSGMVRLGFSPAEAMSLEAADLAGLEPQLLISHLACADEPAHPSNEAQRQCFERVRARMPGWPASFANSSGIFLGTGWLFDLCRPGIALWGGNPRPGAPNPMEPVVRLEAPVLEVLEVDAAAAVGYGATYPIGPGGRIATVPVGYADGLLRSASNRASARVAGHDVAFAGRVSMDLLSLDVSGLPRDLVRPGTMVELIGGPDGIDRLAQAAGTIPYEVLTRLGGRFERTYVGSADPA